MAEIRRNNCKSFLEQLLGCGDPRIVGVLSACPICHVDGQPEVLVGQHPNQPGAGAASSPAAAAAPADPVSSLRSQVVAAGLHVSEHALAMLSRHADLAARLPLCYHREDFVALYEAAAARLGSSTKRAVVCVDSERNIVIDGVFLAHSANSEFYVSALRDMRATHSAAHATQLETRAQRLFIPLLCSGVLQYAYEDGKPYLLKLAKRPEGAEALKLEAAAYERVKNCASASAGFPFLVPVELIQLVDPRPQPPPSPAAAAAAAGGAAAAAPAAGGAAASPGSPPPAVRMWALKMPVYVGTLAECPSDGRLAQLYANAADTVGAAMKALHAAGLVHCDIKPGNIFIDSNGQCLLGDYDAVIEVHKPVYRSTSAFLPEPFRTQFAQRTAADKPSLLASPAVDYAMLACTLLAGMGFAPGAQLQQIEAPIAKLQEQLKAPPGPLSNVQRAIREAQERLTGQLAHCLQKMKL